jgi:hypothetical protein
MVPLPCLGLYLVVNDNLQGHQMDNWVGVSQLSIDFGKTNRLAGESERGASKKIYCVWNPLFSCFPPVRVGQGDNACSD